MKEPFFLLIFDAILDRSFEALMLELNEDEGLTV
jgi:hypothetical protein